MLSFQQRYGESEIPQSFLTVYVSVLFGAMAQAYNDVDKAVNHIDRILHRFKNGELFQLDQTTPLDQQSEVIPPPFLEDQKIPQSAQ